jgi:hypothetical protein
LQIVHGRVFATELLHAPVETFGAQLHHVGAGRAELCIARLLLRNAIPGRRAWRRARSQRRNGRVFVRRHWMIARLSFGRYKASMTDDLGRWQMSGGR